MADLDHHRTSRVPTVLVVLLAATAASPGACPPPPVAARIVGPQGGEVASADGAVRLVIPSGALSTETEISIRPLDVSPESIRGGVAGTAYEFRPDGLTFARPAQLIIRYSPSRLPVGTPESALALARVEDDGRLQPTDGLHIDEVARTVTGTITGFSGFALLAPDRGVPASRLCSGPNNSFREISGSAQDPEGHGPVSGRWISEEEPP